MDMIDKIKFEELFLSCKSALERFVYYKINSKSDGDDILQEIAIAAFRHIDTLSSPESFKPWILKIAANKCSDFYRDLAKRYEIPLDEMTDNVVSMNRYGISDVEIVRDTLGNLADKDKQILFLYYFKNKPQAEIASLLQIPIGTVKSRLHTAKQNFKKTYPFPPKSQYTEKTKKSEDSKDSKDLKGANTMNKTNNFKTLPDIMPEYKITQSTKTPFEVRCEETPGWFIIPKLGEKIVWAIYDFPATERKRSETTCLEVTGKASVHGIEGVEINAVEENPQEANQINGNKTVHRKFIAQLTDTHCRFLAESYINKNGVKVYHTFLDGDDFNMYCGENNCGYEVELKQKGLIQKNGNVILCSNDKQTTDVIGRYDVEIGGKTYDTVCFTDLNRYNPGILSEAYIDKNGKTILWRRFNRNDWHLSHYKKLWNEKFPDNEQVTVNGEIYVHWYDCITDYIL